MALTILDASTQAAVAATSNQQAQIEALFALWASGNVTVRVMNGATLLSTLTHGAWAIAATTPRTATLGARQARTFSTAGTPTKVVFRSGATDIFELTAGVGSGDVSFAAPVSQRQKEKLGTVTITAAASLPVGAAPPASPSITLSATGSPTVGVPFTITALAANLTGAIVGTPENVTGTATFSPTTINPAPGELSKLFSATYAAAGPASVRVTAPGGIVSNTLSVNVVEAVPSVTSLTLAGPTMAAKAQVSAPFMVGPTEDITSNVVVTMNDGGAGGTFSPATLTLTPSNYWQEVVYTPATSGPVFVGMTNNAALSNPPPHLIGVSEAFTVPPNKPERVVVAYTGRAEWAKMVNFRMYHDSGTYDRSHKLLVADASAGVMTHNIGVRAYNLATSGQDRTFEASSYQLRIAPAATPTVSVQVAEATGITPGVTQTFNFALDVTSIAAGWYVGTITGLLNGEINVPYAFYIKKNAVEADPAWMPTQRAVFDSNFSSGPFNHIIDWVPTRFAPQILPLEPRTFEAAPTMLATVDIWRETLVIGHTGNQITRRPNRTASGVLNTIGQQSYHFGDQTTLIPKINLLDGPRGMGVFGMPTHIAPATAAPGGVLRRTVYVLDPWALRKIHEDGYVETLVGYRHKKYARYWLDTQTIYYPAGQPSTPDGALELLGNWDAIPAERRGMHEAWGFAWDTRTLGIVPSGTVPGQGGETPHVVGPVAFISDTQNNRILKLQFGAANRLPPVVTEFCTSTPAGALSDPWDVVFDATDNTLIVSERVRHRIIKISADTGAFVRVVVQGQNYGALDGRAPALTVPLATARTADTVLPEGLFIHQGWLYYGQMALQQIRKINLTTNEIVVAVSETGHPSGSAYHKIAVSDGTFLPAGTILVAGWNQIMNGYPHVYIGDGTGTQWGDLQMYNDGFGVGRRVRGQTDNRMGGISNYSSAVGVGGGRCVFGTSQEGIYELSKRKSSDPTGALNTTDAVLQAVHYATPGIESWYVANGYDMRFGNHYYGLPLPWGENSNLDGALSHFGYSQTTAIIEQPVSATTEAGTRVAFNCRAKGPGVPWYQWQSSTNGGGSYSNIAGATAATLAFDAPTGDMTGRMYRCICSTTAGSVTSSAVTLTVTLTLPYTIPTAGNVVAIGDAAGLNLNIGSVKPADWTTSNWYRSNFDSFGGGVLAPGYSTHGAYVLAGTGGHAHPDHIGATAFNFTTGAWERLDVANVGTFRPAGEIYQGADLNGAPYYEITGTEVPAPPHPYASLAYLPSGAKGSVIYVTRGAIAGPAFDSTASHSFDLATRLWQRRAGAGPFSMVEGGVVFDEARGRYWLSPDNLHNYTSMRYLRLSDFTWQETVSSGNFFSSNLSGAGYPRTMLHDTLLLRNAGPSRGLFIYDPDDPTYNSGGFFGWTPVAVTGTLPDPQVSWARHSNGNWYSHPAVTGTGATAAIFRIRPPANPRTGTWQVDTITLNSPLPETTSYSGTYQAKHYTRLFYVPSIDCLAWIPGKDLPVYIFKPGS